mgnify:CR=1 FL=1
MHTLSLIGLVGGLALLIVLTMRGMNLFIATPLCALLVALTGGIALLPPLAAEGAPVVAVNDGVIRQIGSSPELGRYIVLEDTYGNRYTYGLTESISAGHSAPYRIGAWQSPMPVDRPIIYVDNDSDLQQFCRSLRSSDYAIYQRRNARQIIARYRDEMIKAIVVRRMLTEGFDYAHCKAVYIARKTRSRIAVMQMAGRALRPYNGRTATIFAINEDTEYLLAQAFQKAG